MSELQTTEGQGTETQQTAGATPLSVVGALLGTKPGESAAAGEPPAPSGTQALPEKQAGNEKWYNSVFQRDENKGLAELKAWNTADNMLDSHRNLEKLVGVDKLPLPKNEADKEGWDRVYTRLGRPRETRGLQAACTRAPTLCLRGRPANRCTRWD